MSVFKTIQHKDLLGVVWLAMILYGTINIALAFLMMDIVDSVTAQNGSLFFKTLLVTLLLMVFEFCMGMASKYLLNLYSKRELTLQKDRRYKKVLYTADPASMDLSSFSTDMDLLYTHYYTNIAYIAYDITRLLLSTLSIIYLNWKIAVVVAISIILPFVIPVLFQTKLQKSTQAYKAASQSYLGFVQDSFSGLQEIRTYFAFPFFLSRHERFNQANEQARLQNKMWLSFNNVFSASVSTLSFVAIMAYCGYLCLQGESTIGALIAVTQLMNSIVGPVSQLSGEVGQIQSAKKLVLEEADETNYQAKQLPTGHVQALLAEDLSFSYDPQHPVLKNLDLRLEYGKRYAIVGKSGIGKSTLAKLLSGMLQGDGGAVRMLDETGREIPREELSYRVQYVSQQPYLFNLSAKENVALGQAETTEDWQDLLESLEIGQLFGAEDLLLTNREGVSGGQKQRLVIARALTHKADVLILDEPTANLDEAIALRVMNYILHSQCGIILVITHDTSDEMLSLFDQVIRL